VVLAVAVIEALVETEPVIKVTLVALEHCLTIWALAAAVVLALLVPMAPVLLEETGEWELRQALRVPRLPVLVAVAVPFLQVVLAALAALAAEATAPVVQVAPPPPQRTLVVAAVALPLIMGLLVVLAAKA
jgi:hypothetical protein